MLLPSIKLSSRPSRRAGGANPCLAGGGCLRPVTMPHKPFPRPSLPRSDDSALSAKSSFSGLGAGVGSPDPSLSSHGLTTPISQSLTAVFRLGREISEEPLILCGFPLLHHLHKVFEQVMRVMRPRRSLRVILHGEQWQIPMPQSFERVVVQVDVSQIHFALR